MIIHLFIIQISIDVFVVATVTFMDILLNIIPGWIRATLIFEKTACFLR